MNGIDRSIGPIFTHGSVERLTRAYRESGIDLPPTTYVGDVTNKKDFVGSLIVAPPSAQGSTWLRRFGSHSTGFCLGLDDGARRTPATGRRPRFCHV
jgi:putative mRNA 3-end processing factor